MYRHGAHGKNFWANVTVGPGRFHVVLKFAERRPATDDPLTQAVTIHINGERVVENMDIAATAGVRHKAVNLVFNDIVRNAVGMLLLGVWACVGIIRPAQAGEPIAEGGVFAKTNLVAWCIVPFDTQKRNPQQRAEMLQRLGLRHFAYDWRQEHVATFEEEIIEIRKRSIDYFAFWDFHPEITPLVGKHHVSPQFWITAPSPADADQDTRVEAAAKQLQGMVDKTRELGCRLGMYNHGGWGGEPANMVAVVKRLRQDGQADHVGIVYNFHHGHGHIQDFSEVLAAMQPYLLCLNLNGMNDNAQPQILPVGSGQHEQAMMEAVRRSGYSGPIGILGHRDDMDAEVSLRQNLDGIKQVLEQMGDRAALKTYD